MIFTLKSLPAHNGDCFIISFGEQDDVKNIIVDGGRSMPSYKILKNQINELEEKGQLIDLLILTHIDEDHIMGLIRLFRDAKIDKSIFKEIWFNSKEVVSSYFCDKSQKDQYLTVQMNNDSNISYNQGISFGTLLEEYNLGYQGVIMSGQNMHLGEAIIEVLSPNEDQLNKLLVDWEKEFSKNTNTDILVSSKTSTDYSVSIDELLQKKFTEDDDIVNGSSIAFLLTFKEKRILMLGDSFPSTVVENIKKKLNGNRLSIDLVKVSHHGSKNNTSNDLLELIECKNFLISTNGSSHGHPHKEALVKIANRFKGGETETKFYFNYKGVQDKIFTQEEKELLNIKCVDSECIDKNILVVDVWNGLEH